MKTKLTIIAIMAIAASLTISSCGSSKQAVAPTSVTDSKAMQQNLGVQAEVEIIMPCNGGNDSNEDFFRCNGLGKSIDRQTARDAVYNDALARLSTKLEGVAAMQTRRMSSSSTAGTTETGLTEDMHAKIVSTTKTIAQAKIAGYRTECEKFTREGNSYNCYVTIEYGKKALLKPVYDKLNSDKLLRIDYDFDKYMKEFDESLKEYEAKNK
jgi:hypothetical protein